MSLYWKVGLHERQIIGVIYNQQPGVRTLLQPAHNGGDQLVLILLVFSRKAGKQAQIDRSVLNYQAVPGTNATEITVLGSDSKLWYEFAPF